MNVKILVVEDEVKIARFLELELKYEGYEVVIANDGRAGLEEALSGEIDLVVLDVMLPKLSGIEVCRRIRQSSSVPIIMLTAKDDVSDKVMGLDMGADDYMTKPFAIEELLARIRVALNRNKGDTTKERQSKELKVGALVLDLMCYKVTFEDEEIVLTKKEFELLEYLMRNENIVLTRDKLLEVVWGYEYMGDTNVIDVYIRYLRSKIDQKYNVKFIHTIRGVGYLFKYEEE
ncbi:MAG: response regulator transcription factor [Eubacteriales bacterium]